MVVIKIGENILHSPQMDDPARLVISPHLRIELNKPDTLSFTLPPNHALFGQIQKRKDVVSVFVDGVEYFNGQIIDERPNLYNMLEYTCEGALSYLSDTVQRPFKIEESEAILVAELFARFIQNHNSQVSAEKQFTVGIVNATDKTIHTDSTDYATTLHEINLLCIGRYGGYLRVRRENNVNYIDWLKELTDVCTQTVEFGQNIIDIDGLIDTREVGSVLIPLGAKKSGKKITVADVNGGLDYIESPTLIEKYDRIVVVKDFPTVKDASELLSKGNEYLAEMEDTETFDITAVDLSRLGVNTSALRVGLLTPIRAPNHGINKNKIIYAADMDLENIENSVYTFGVPRQTLTEALAETARGGGAAGQKIEELSEIITDAYIDINRLEGEILLRAYQEEMDTRFSEAWIAIDGVEAQIVLKADETKVNAIDGRLSTAESSITVNKESITALTQTVDENGQTLSSAVLRLDNVEGEVEILAEKQVSLDEYENRLATAESSIVTNAESITALSKTVGENGDTLTSALLRLNGVEGEVEILAEKQVSLDEYENRLATAESSITTNAESITALSQTVDDNGNQISGALVRLNGVEAEVEILAQKQVSLDQYENRLATAESSITTNAQSITALSQTVDENGAQISGALLRLNGVEGEVEILVEKQVSLDEYENRLSTAESSIKINADNILLKADQSVVDALTERVSSAEVDIDAANAAIRLKANQSVVDDLTERVSSAEVDIDAANAAIALKANQTTVNALTTRVSTAEADIDAANAKITLKANQSTVNALSTRVSSAEADIDAANAAIALKANQSVVDDLTERVSSAEVDIDGANAAIRLKANQSVVDDLTERISSAEIDIDGANAAILLKAEQSVVDDLGNRVTTAESQIIINANGIQTKVSKDGVISSINQSAESVKISASKIVLDGLVTASQLQAAKAEISAATLTGVTTNVLSAQDANTQYLSASSFSLGNTLISKKPISMGPISTGSVLSVSTASLDLSHSHAVSVSDDGTVTLGAVSVTGGNFKIADTKTYKEGVSAAKQSVREGVVLTNTTGWQNGTFTVKALNANGQTYAVSLPDFSVSGGTSFTSDHKTTVSFSTASVTSGPLKSVTVDATSVYNSVTASQDDWLSNGVKYVRLSNGKIYGVRLPAFTAEGGDEFDADHQTTVGFYAKDVKDSALLSVTVDASSVYADGVAYGKSIAEDVTLSSAGWINGVNTVTASNGATLPVNLPTFTTGIGTFNDDHIATVYFFTPSVNNPLKTATVDASGVYEEGADSVTLSASGWVDGHNIVSASNGKQKTIILPEFTVSGGTSFDSNHKTTVYFSTASVTSGPLKSVTVDASSVYTEGYNAGWAAARAEVRRTTNSAGTEVYIYGPSETVNASARFYTVGLNVAITSHLNSAPSKVTANAAANVTINSSTVITKTASNTLTINSGML